MLSIVKDLTVNSICKVHCRDAVAVSTIYEVVWDPYNVYIH